MLDDNWWYNQRDDLNWLQLDIDEDDEEPDDDPRIVTTDHSQGTVN